jgi:hypothetical protein
VVNVSNADEFVAAIRSWQGGNLTLQVDTAWLDLHGAADWKPSQTSSGDTLGALVIQGQDLASCPWQQKVAAGPNAEETVCKTVVDGMRPSLAPPFTSEWAGRSLLQGRWPVAGAASTIRLFKAPPPVVSPGKMRAVLRDVAMVNLCDAVYPLPGNRTFITANHVFNISAREQVCFSGSGTTGTNCRYSLRASIYATASHPLSSLACVRVNT